MPWSLSQNKLFAALSAVILTTIIAVIGYFFTRPYVQYEEGQVYKSGNVAVASLRLENNGYFDAEHVLVEATFPEPIVEVTSGNALSPYSITSGGKGFKTVIGSIPRINPAQPVYVYFTVDNSTGIIGEYMPGFVRQVSFKNGLGSNQPPKWRLLLPLFMGVVSGALISWATRYLKRARATAKELEEAKLSLSAHREGLKLLTDKVDEVWRKAKGLPPADENKPDEPGVKPPETLSQ